MSITVNDKNLGHATAYAYAKSAGYTGTEAEFAELLGNIADDLSEIEDLRAIATTLPAGSAATASYADGVLTLGIPKGDKGDKGDTGAQGPKGDTGEVSYAEFNPVVADVTQLKSDLNIQNIEPLNKINPEEIAQGKQYNWQGNFVDAANRNTTGFIPVSQGDVLWMFQTNSAGTTLVAANAERLVEFASDKTTKTKLSGQYPFTMVQTEAGGYVYAYTVENANTAYVRVSYPSSYAYPSIYVNADGTKTYVYYEPYFQPYTDSVRLENIEKYIEPQKGYYVDGHINAQRQRFDFDVTNVIPKDVTAITIATVTSFQGFAYSNGVIFQLYSNNVVVLIDAETGDEIAELPISSEHGDSIDFSDEYYDSGDEFPLAYISTDSTPCVVNVVRITRTATTLIRSYKWEDITKTGYFAGANIDPLNNVLYLLGYKNNSYNNPTGNYMILTSWDLSETTTNQDSTITPTLVSTKKLPFMNTVQGQTFFNNNIWALASSVANGTILYVIDPAIGIVARITDVPAQYNGMELEGITFVPDGYKFDAWLHANARGTPYTKFIFSI